MPRAPRLTSVRNTAIGIGMAITITTGATVTIGRTTTATATMRRVSTVTTGTRYYGGGPGVTFSFGSGGYRGW